jgi:Uma2 family endonuclease
MGIVHYLDEVAYQQDREEFFYPETDGLPTAGSTLQFEWIVTFKGGLDALVADREDVFVAGNLFWYPIEGNLKIASAPDAMVVFGRPKGHRRAYRQWVEDNVAPQFVIEILSHSNSVEEMLEKLHWYEQYGVQEYYLYNPDTNYCAGWVREGETLHKIPQMNGFRSPLLGITFLLNATTLTILRPDGRTFEGYMDAVRRADAEEQLREEMQFKNQRLAAKLRELGINPDDV